MRSRSFIRLRPYRTGFASEVSRKSLWKTGDVSLKYLRANLQKEKEFSLVGKNIIAYIYIYTYIYTHTYIFNGIKQQSVMVTLKSLQAKRDECLKPPRPKIVFCLSSGTRIAAWDIWLTGNKNHKNLSQVFTTENTHIFNRYLLTSHYESDTVSDTVLSPGGTKPRRCLPWGSCYLERKGVAETKWSTRNRDWTEPEKVEKRHFGCILKDEEEIFMKRKGS